MRPKPASSHKGKIASAGGLARAATAGLGAPQVPAAFQRIVAGLSKSPGVTVEAGWGGGALVVKCRAKIFVMLVRGDVVMKLPRLRVDELVARHVGKRFDPRRDGRLMKEWVVLPPACADTPGLAREAYRFASKAKR
jgi:hypothetical protein